MTGRFCLIGRPGSGSAACEAVLTLAGAAFDVVDMDKTPDGGAPPELLAVNPLGQVPVLVLSDGRTMTESAAICLLIADKYPEAGLAPAPDAPERADYLRWMLYLASAIYPSDLRCYYPDRYTIDAEGGPGVRAAAIARKAFEWRVFADALAAKPFLLGDRASAADIYACMLLSWNEDFAAFRSANPLLSQYYFRIAAIGGVAGVWARHGMPA